MTEPTPAQLAAGVKAALACKDVAPRTSFIREPERYVRAILLAALNAEQGK